MIATWRKVMGKQCVLGTGDTAVSKINADWFSL